MAVLGSTRFVLRLAALLAMSVLVSPSNVPGSDILLATRHRIQLPDGSQLMLRREYEVIFRRPMRWSEGLLLEPVHIVESQERPGSLRPRHA
jgi:hypothetical protein